jgi:hypothetical protein
MHSARWERPSGEDSSPDERSAVSLSRRALRTVLILVLLSLIGVSAVYWLAATR